jgi:predicted nucleic acid-binding protein
LLLARQAHKVIETTEKILAQAEKLESSGFDGYDAIHLASAEQGKVDIFLTTDDNIQKISSRNKKLFSFIVTNPVKWLEEVLK